MYRWLLKCQHHNDYTLVNTQTKYWCFHVAKKNEFYSSDFYFTEVFLSIRLGEEFDEETTDGRKCKTTVTMEGNKLITSQKATGGGKDALAVITIRDSWLFTFYTNVQGERVLWWRRGHDHHCGRGQLQTGLQEDLMWRTRDSIQ